MSSSAILTLVVAAAARVGAPMIKGLLRDKVGGEAGEIGAAIIDAVAGKAGVSVPQLETIPDRDLESAVAAVESEAPALLDRYLASQKEASRFMEVEMSKGPTWAWTWRPAAMWLMLVCIAWYVFGIPITAALMSAALGIPVSIVPAVEFGDFTTVFVTFIGLYMGGHTAKAVFKK